MTGSARDNSAEDSGDQVRTQSEQGAPSFIAAPLRAHKQPEDQIIDHAYSILTDGDHCRVVALINLDIGTFADLRLWAAAPDLHAICADLEDEIDRQTYDYAKTFHGDIPDDAEFNVNLTWKQIHALTKAINKAIGSAT